MGAIDDKPGEASGGSEAAVQAKVRLEASARGWRLWRNNVGAATAPNGQLVRYGLCNDSPALNRLLKSSDLIGIKPIRIEYRHVGTTLGQFVARETKKAGWEFKGTDRENAQLSFLSLVTGLGGDAKFLSSVDEL